MHYLFAYTIYYTWSNKIGQKKNFYPPTHTYEYTHHHRTETKVFGNNTATSTTTEKIEWETKRKLLHFWKGECESSAVQKEAIIMCLLNNIIQI